MKKQQHFFKGLKVVELANVLAGPATGMFFAELGATVIKIENKTTGGDITRKWKLPGEAIHAPVSAYYASANWNKKSVFANLLDAVDREKVFRHFQTADIVITNYKAGDAKKLGMDYRSLKKLNPKLIYAHLSGFGENDPRTAYDLILQAETGFMSMNGTVRSGPVKMPVALIDLLAAHQLKEAILIALLHRNQTGKGGSVTVSLYDAAIASLANQASNWLNAGYLPGLQGSLHPNIAPYGEVFVTVDNKQLVLAIGSDHQFQALCNVLNASELGNDKKFISNTGRLKNRKQLQQQLQKYISSWKCNPLIAKFVKAGVPAGVINNLKNVFKEKNTKKLILSDKNSVMDLKRVKTVAFHLNLTTF